MTGSKGVTTSPRSNLSDLLQANMDLLWGWQGMPGQLKSFVKQTSSKQCRGQRRQKSTYLGKRT